MKQLDPAQTRHTFSRSINSRGMLPIVLDVEASQGINLVDALTGRTYLDFFGFFATSTLGMNHPKMTTDAEANERLRLAALNKITNSDVQTGMMARFLQSFGRVAQRDAYPYAFFISGGALAVENALKAAFDWKVRMNLANGHARERGHQVLHFREAFHGRSGYTLSLTNTSDPAKTKHFPRFDWPRILNPKITFPLSEHLASVERLEAQALEQARAAFRDRGDDIACILIETIQGEGGDNHFRPEFLRALNDLCQEHHALLIFDEVQCGAGITGTYWAWEQLGVAPDIIVFGKKTQVCGILAGRRLDEVDDHVFVAPSRINSTWGGNLVDMVRYDRILAVMKEDDLLGHTRSAGKYLLHRLEELEAQSSVVTNARGRGLMCAIDLATRELRDQVRARCRELGLILLGCGAASIRFRPPLIVDEREIDQAIGHLSQALHDAHRSG